MSEVAEAVSIAFHPAKLNYELLGNTNSHLHWHISTRFATNNPNPAMPIWTIDTNIKTLK